MNGEIKMAERPQGQKGKKDKMESEGGEKGSQSQERFEGGEVT